ncbi:hypothetical protein ACOME3_010373 [Neoechinorhynchus agilis]
MRHHIAYSRARPEPVAILPLRQLKSEDHFFEILEVTPSTCFIPSLWNDRMQGVRDCEIIASFRMIGFEVIVNIPGHLFMGRTKYSSAVEIDDDPEPDSSGSRTAEDNGMRRELCDRLPPSAND